MRWTQHHILHIYQPVLPFYRLRQDIVGALAFAAENPGVDGVFNAGYGASMSILKLAQEIVRVTGSSSTIEFQPVRSGDIRHSTSDPSKLLDAGWKPAYDVARGLELLATL